jgi:hypothetical protein
MTEYNKKHLDYPKPFTTYAHRTVTFSAGADSDISSSGLFDKLEFAYEVLIRNGSTAISVKFNSTDNDPVPIGASDSFGVSGYLVHSIYITASGGGTANIYTTGWK